MSEQRAPAAAGGLDPDLLEILRCPVTRSRLSVVVDAAGATWLHNESGTRYPVTDGIPVLLPDAGVPVPDALVPGAPVPAPPAPHGGS